MSTFVHIGQTIRAKRIALGLTQEQLAHRCGMEKPDISNIENGKRNMTIDTLCRVSEGVDCEVDFGLVDVGPDVNKWKEYRGIPTRQRAWVKLNDDRYERVLFDEGLGAGHILNFDGSPWKGNHSHIMEWQPYVRKIS